MSARTLVRLSCSISAGRVNGAEDKAVFLVLMQGHLDLLKRGVAQQAFGGQPQ
jgi:hypothetical protein